MTTHTIWVVDDEPNLVKRIAIAGRSRKWNVVALAPDTSNTLPDEPPDLILLDYSLDTRSAGATHKRKAWFAALTTRKLCGKTLIMTNHLSMDVQAWAKRKGWAGVLIKPLDLERVSELLAMAVPLHNVGPLGDMQRTTLHHAAINAESVQNWFDNLSQAICILDNQGHLIVQNSVSANDAIFTSEQFGAVPTAGRATTIVYNLLRQIQAATLPSGQAQHWEWHNEKCKWVEWNLLALNATENSNDKGSPSDALLLTRILHDTYTPLEAASLSAKLSLKAYVDHLAYLLNKQWGITRLRLYAVETVVGETANDTAKCLHLLPLAQVGEGFKVKNQPGIQEWLQTEFNFQDGISALTLMTLPPGTAIQCRVDNRQKKVREGPSALEWGNAGTRAQMMIGSSAADQTVNFIGQLAFDRRADHLPHALATTSLLYGSISDDDLKGMAGILAKVNEDLFQRLQQHRDLRMTAWQKTISETLANSVAAVSKVVEFAEQPYARARRLICSAFDALLRDWNSLQREPLSVQELAGRPTTADIAVGHADSDLLELYVAEGISEDVLRCEIGANQPVYKLRAHRHSTWRKVWPFMETWRRQDYETFVVQDLLAARLIKAHHDKQYDPITQLLAEYKLRRLPDEDIAAAAKQYESIGSWVGIKIPCGGEKYWILVAMARGKDVWTSSRIEWLQALAKNLTTVLRWWEAEVKRDWFSHALAHELAKPMQLLEADMNEWLSNWKTDGPPVTQERRGNHISRIKIDGALALVKMHAHMLADIQEITSERLRENENEASTICTLKEVLLSINWVFKHKAKSLAMLPDDAPGLHSPLAVPEKALAHVLTNLLLNAAKFNWDPFFKQVRVTTKLAHQLAYEILEIDICNAVAKPIPEERKDEMLLPYVRGNHSGTTEGMGAGLAVVDALCRQHKMLLKIADEKDDNFDGHWQIFRLSILLHTQENQHEK